jgi:hypothetical protein
MIPLAADPVTVVVRIGAEEFTGVAVKVVDVIAIGFTNLGIQATWNSSPDWTAVTPAGAPGKGTRRYAVEPAL